MIELNQNDFNRTIFNSVLSDNKHFAIESGEPIADYLIRDFEQNPENWNCVFEYAYDEISSRAKKERKKIIVNLLVAEGHIPSNY
jgi:hypothetical protein